MSADPYLVDLHRRVDGLRSLEAARQRPVLAARAVNQEGRRSGVPPTPPLVAARRSHVQTIDPRAQAQLVEAIGALQELCAKLERLVAGGMPQSTLERAPATMVLTPRQLEILSHLAAGRSTESIARELWLSVATVRNHIARTMRALGAHSRLEAVAKARELNLL
jgi:DNA-binding CsgD family transcriptional regulator